MNIRSWGLLLFLIKPLDIRTGWSWVLHVAWFENQGSGLFTRDMGHRLGCFRKTHL